MIRLASDERKASGDTGATPFGIPYTEEELALLRLYEHRLTGTCSHTLDSKGRLVVPAVYRDSLGSGFVIAPSQDFKSIALYSNIQWVRRRERYARQALRNTRVARYLERFDALSYRGQECDGQGRVLLPAKIRQLLLGEEKDVEISGAGDHIKVAAATRDKDDFNEFIGDLPAILESMDSLELDGMGEDLT